MSTNKEDEKNVDKTKTEKHLSECSVQLSLLANFISSPLLIFLNKWIYTTEGVQISAASLTWIHLFVTSALNTCCLVLGMFQFKRLPLGKMFPVSLTFCGFIVLTNISLQLNTIGTYQVIKTMTTPCVIVLQCVLYKRITSVKLIATTGCFYHLTQATWRKLQAEGLSVLYKTDERTKHFCGMLDGLAFLPLEDVEEGMAVIRERADEVLSPVVDYFDSTYVSGTYRSVVTEGRMRFRRTPPRFEPALWNVHTATLRDGDRTNNVCEGWNNGFRHLVGHNNPSLWVLVNCLQKDNASVETDVFRQRTGQPPKKRKRTNRQSHQAKLKKLCEDRQGGTRSVESFLEAIGHCIRLA